MPYTSTYVDNGKGVYKKGTGIVTGLEIFNSARQEGLSSGRPGGIRYGLVDFSETTELKITTDDVRRIVEANRKVAAGSPGELVAIIAPGPLPYAMARLWHTLSDDLGWKSNVFHARQDALAWLRKELAGAAGSLSIREEFPFLHEE